MRAQGHSVHTYARMDASVDTHALWLRIVRKRRALSLHPTSCVGADCSSRPRASVRSHVHVLCFRHACLSQLPPRWYVRTCSGSRVSCVRAYSRSHVCTYVRTYVRKDAHRQRSTRAEQHDWHDWHDCRTYIRTCAFRRLAHLPSTARMTCTTDTIGTTRADSTTLALVALGTLGTSVTPCIVGTLGVACQHSKAVLHTCAHVRTYVRTFAHFSRLAQLAPTEARGGRRRMRKTHARLYVRDKTRAHERTHAARSSAQAAEHLPLPIAWRPARTSAHGAGANGGGCGLKR